MIFHGLIFAGIISFLHITDAQISPCNEKHSFLMNNDKNVSVVEVHSGKEKYQLTVTAPSQNVHYGETTDHRLGSARRFRRHHRHLRTMHGIVNIIGWGILLPTGVIAARHFKKLPQLKSDEWYSLHIRSQMSGFILGTVGWGLGMSIRNAAKEHNLSVHGILGTIIFALTIIQVIIAAYLRPNQEERESKKYLAICHHLLGYVLIILIITNIYQGIDNQNPAAANIWKWLYSVIVGVFAFIFLALELLRWIKS
ncbi:hypothetical protein ACH5RR_014766 [Cinchona calisaya]|uniref:Cytochrome b561 domain-containing protein n=1 Tax=Cinchona calisaya TaxID=153742 RepID=A0ABD2ZTX7_9GENT